MHFFFVGTQFWEADKTLKFLAEQQYFNKDKSSTDNPVKVCKLLYLAFGSALSCTSIRCHTCYKGEEKYEDDLSRHGIQQLKYDGHGTF